MGIKMALLDGVTAVYDIFWDENFWLPNGVKWKDFEEQSETMYHPSARDLKYVILCAGLLFIIRKLYERLVATPIGRYFGIRETKRRRPQPNDVLERSYRGKKFPDSDTIQGLAKQTDLAPRVVERWFRMRRNKDRPSDMKRFTEASWRFTFYFSVFIYGVVVLWNNIVFIVEQKPWFSDSTKCWIGYPHHHISKEIFWYYMVEIGFYSSLMFSQFIDVKRKDFWEMFFHHIATLLLLCFSWCGNFVRVGTLVLVIHDAVDYWMEAAKMAKYIKAQRLCDFLFAIFGIVWFVTRLIIYPVRIIISTLFYAHPIVGFGPVYYTYNILLISLQILHVVWSFFIVQVLRDVYKEANTAAVMGPITRPIQGGKINEVTDIRSSEEEAVSEEENGTTNHIKHKNNIQSS